MARGAKWRYVIPASDDTGLSNGSCFDDDAEGGLPRRGSIGRGRGITNGGTTEVSMPMPWNSLP